MLLYGYIQVDFLPAFYTQQSPRPSMDPRRPTDRHHTRLKSCDLSAEMLLLDERKGIRLTRTVSKPVRYQHVGHTMALLEFNPRYPVGMCSLVTGAV